MTPQQTLTQLNELRLTGMAEQLCYQFDPPNTYDELGFIERLSLLVNHEATVRDNRKVTRLLKQAKLRYRAQADDIDYRTRRGLHKDTVAQLLALDGVNKSRNVIIQGPTGTGKTFLACVLGQAACEHGISTKYIRASRLFEAMTLSHGDGSYTKLLAQIAKIKLLIIDDWGLDTLRACRIINRIREIIWADSSQPAILSKRHQSQLFLTLDSLVSSEHPYRKLDELLCFGALSKPFSKIYATRGPKGRGVEFGLRALVLQFMEDLSDREMERYLSENLAAKWFCDSGLEQSTPDHSYFGDFRSRIGTRGMMNLFDRVRSGLVSMGLVREVFTFVDASQLVSKLTTWDDRDKAIKMGLEEFNNKTVDKVAADKQARFGCKGNSKYWYGYKEHASVDMQSGLINKIAATSAEVTDASGLKHVCPKSGAVYADKGYCVSPAKTTLRRNGCHDATIKKNNMHGKNRDKDRWISKIRSPYERVFAHRNKRVRYKGLAKVQFQVGIRGLCFNLKRLMALGVERVELVPA